MPVYSDIQSIANGPAFGQPLATKIKSNKMQGRMRYIEAIYVVPPAGVPIAERITWCKLPLRSRLVNHLCKLIFNAGAASSTITLGDNVNTARHLAATSVTAAGSAIPLASEIVNTGNATTTIGSNTIVITASPGAFQVGCLITGTGIPANTIITAISDMRIGGSVTISNAASATGAGVAMTVTGAGYEVTDDTNSVANNYLSTTDDASLVSLVAGAALPAGQVIQLKVAFVQD